MAWSVIALVSSEPYKTAEPIEMPFGLRTRVGRRKDKINRIRQVAPMCPHGRVRWRHLANTIEPSVCCVDAALCQVTLTTCSSWHWCWRAGIKGATSSIKSPVVDEERMCPGHWLGSVLCAPFSALTLMIGWQGRTSGP